MTRIGFGRCVASPRQRDQVHARAAGRRRVGGVERSGVRDRPRHRPGIDPEFLPRIFDRFTQADPSPTRSDRRPRRGTVARAAPDRAARRRDPRRKRRDGVAPCSRFVCRCTKRIKSKAPEAPAPAVPTRPSPPLTGLRVLLVDHDQDSREILGVALEGRGAAVRLVGVGRRRVGAARNLAARRPGQRQRVPRSRCLRAHREGRRLEADRGGRIPALALTYRRAAVDERMR